jgi:uncharacterized protein
MEAPHYIGYDVCLVQDCNLRCRYCSTGYGQWGEKPKIMSQEAIDRAVSFMIENAEDKFRVSFSGGETLLAFDSLNYFIEKIIREKEKTGKKVLIEVSTNGVNITKKIADYLATQRVNLSFSLDGDKITNDRNRIMPAGVGVYDNVRKNFELYRNSLEKNCYGDARIKAECTIDEKADLFRSVLHLFGIGFTDVIARPVGDSLFTGYKRGNSFEVFLSSFRKLVRYILEPLDAADIIAGNYSRTLLNIKRPLPHIISGKGEISSCEVVNKSICIMADGEITPCFLFNDFRDEHFTFGDVFSGVDQVKAANLRGFFEHLTSDCASCWCRSLCRVCYRELIDIKEKTVSSEEPDYCWMTRKSMAILIEEASRQYKLQPVFIYE